MTKESKRVKPNEGAEFLCIFSQWIIKRKKLMILRNVCQYINKEIGWIRDFVSETAHVNDFINGRCR